MEYINGRFMKNAIYPKTGKIRREEDKAQR